MFRRIFTAAGLASLALSGVPATAAGSSVALRDGEVLLEVVGRASFMQTAQSVSLSYSVPIDDGQGSGEAAQLAAMLRENNGKAQNPEVRAKVQAAAAAAAKAAATLVQHFRAAGFPSARLYSAIAADGEPNDNLAMMVAFGGEVGDRVVVIPGVALDRISQANAIAKSAGAKASPQLSPSFDDGAQMRRETAVRAQADAQASAAAHASSLNMRVARVLRISEHGDNALGTPGGITDFTDLAATLGNRSGVRRRVIVNLAVDYALVPK